MENEIKFKCIECENNFRENEGVFIDGDTNKFCCDECLEQGRYFHCEKCNEWHDGNTKSEYDIHNSNGDYIYSVCDEWISDFCWCDGCEKYFENGDMNSLNNGDICLCESCFDNTDKFYCEMCEQYFTNDYSKWYYEDLNGNNYTCCEECGRDTIFYCDNCGHYFHDNDIEYDDASDNHYCLNCIQELNNNIKNTRLTYHSYIDWQKYYGNGENKENTKRFFGVELEVDTNEYYTSQQVDDICKNINSNLNTICECDGSLNRQTGIEIITHPSTIKYYYEHYDDFNNTFKMLLDKNYLSHDLTQCGLHIHVTRPNDDVIDKILVVLEHYKEEVLKFSRRVSSQMHYCRFLSDYSSNKEKDNEFFKALYYIKKDTTKKSDRYMALNLTNSKTIEFRIFRGTLNTNTFYSCLEFVKNIVELCEKEDDLSKITWERLTSGRYISKYIKEHDIVTNKTIYDNSKLIELRELRENKIKEKIIAFTKKCIIKEFNKIKNINNIDTKYTTNDIYTLCNEKASAFNNLGYFSEYMNNLFNNKDKFNLDKFIDKLNYNLSYLDKSQTKELNDYIKNLVNKGAN